MKPPADGWDAAEREALRELEPELDALRRRHAADPPIDLLQAARAGVLPDEWQSDADRHLATDRWARTLTEDLEAMPVTLTAEDEGRLLRRIQHAGRETTRRVSWGWRPRPAFTVAALAVLVLSLSSVWYVKRDTAPQAPAAVPAPPTTPGIAPAFVLALEPPSIRLSVAALTWRGTGDRTSLVDQLRPGLDAFRAADYATADRELARVAAAFPKTVEPLYYQGVSRLFLSDYNGAVQSLSAAARLADASFRQDVTWYLAVAEERAGMIAAAREHVGSVCQSQSERAAQACAALAKMQ